MAIAPQATTKKVMRTAKQTVDRFNESWSYAKQNHHQRWRRNYKLYNNKRVNPSYRGITNTFVPLSYSTIETITASLCAGRPSIEFVPMDMYRYIIAHYAHHPEVMAAMSKGDISGIDPALMDNGEKPDLKALNAKFDYYWECDNWDVKTVKTVRSGAIYGLSCEWIYWDDDKPRIINMNARDAIVDPSLTDPMQLWTNPDDYYTGRRYLTTVDALKGVEIVDAKTGKVKPRFRNLDRIKLTGSGAGNGGEQTDKEIKEQMLGSVSTAGDLVEVIEIWDGQSITSVAQRTVTIESRPNALGIHCLALGRLIADESLIYGKAIIDPIAGPQELLNDVTNQRVDAVTDALNPQAELDPAYSAWIPKLKNLPSTVYPFKPGSMQYLQKPIVPTGAFTETQNIKDDIRETTAADQVINGSKATGDPTATEINAQLNQAGARFEIYVRMLEREALYQRAKIVYHMMLYYVKDTQLVPTMGVDGPQYRRFKPGQFDKSYEPQIRLQASVLAGKQHDANQATQAYQVIIADPTNDLWQAKKILYPKMFDLDEDELDKIIGSQPPQAAPGGLMPGMGMEPGAPAPGEATPPPQMPAPEPALDAGVPA